MRKPLSYILIFLFFTISSCIFTIDTKKDFYSCSKVGDLWRVPLVEPYQVISPSNSGSDDWFLVVKNHNIYGPNFFSSGDEFQLSSIKTVGIWDSVIVITNENEYWPKSSGQYPSTLIIDLKTNNQYIFSDQHHELELNEKLVELGLQKIEMFKWKTVKDDFLEDMKLPEDWINQRTTIE